MGPVRTLQAVAVPSWGKGEHRKVFISPVWDTGAGQEVVHPSQGETDAQAVGERQYSARIFALSFLGFLSHPWIKAA